MYLYVNIYEYLKINKVWYLWTYYIFFNPSSHPRNFFLWSPPLIKYQIVCLVFILTISHRKLCRMGAGIHGSIFFLFGIPTLGVLYELDARKKVFRELLLLFFKYILMAYIPYTVYYIVDSIYIYIRFYYYYCTVAVGY